MSCSSRAESGVNGVKRDFIDHSVSRINRFAFPLLLKVLTKSRYTTFRPPRLSNGVLLLVLAVN